MDQSGTSSEGDKKFFSKKKLPKEAIELDESRRGDPSWINAVVEVGLNNSLLQNGHLEVIDAPGMSENEALDKVVAECLHGALQVIIYVVDGNSSLRLQVSMLLKTVIDVKQYFYPITDAGDYMICFSALSCTYLRFAEKYLVQRTLSEQTDCQERQFFLSVENNRSWFGLALLSLAN